MVAETCSHQSEEQIKERRRARMTLSFLIKIILKKGDMIMIFVNVT
jgi:hypothetical protein